MKTKKFDVIAAKVAAVIFPVMIIAFSYYLFFIR